jgi:hypothetical protein
MIRNLGQDMTAAVAAIDAVRAATGAHVAVVHHCGKDEARGGCYVDAYLKAGFQCTRATAYVNGHRLRWKPEVANYIAALQRREWKARERAREAQSAGWMRVMKSKLMR